jgi:hypothetical protein
MIRSKIWRVPVGVVILIALLSFSLKATAGEYDAPDTSGGNDTAHGYYQPPEQNQQPVLREPTQGEREQDQGVIESPMDYYMKQEKPEIVHGPEDRETEQRSMGEGSQ